MAIHTYNKLVRDRIPEFVTALGKFPTVRNAATEEVVPLLKAKLQEEVNEYLSSGEPEELADIIEVIRGLAHWTGTTPEHLEQLRLSKHAERGGFEEGVFLISVEE